MVKVLWESVFKESGNFSTVLTMAITNREEVAVFEATEMRNGNPIILVDFIGVGRGQTSFSGKGKFSNAVGRHLLGIPRDKVKLFFNLLGAWSFFIFTMEAILVIIWILEKPISLLIWN